jgi:acyl dehydratase
LPAAGRALKSGTRAKLLLSLALPKKFSAKPGKRRNARPLGLERELRARRVCLWMRRCSKPWNAARLAGEAANQIGAGGRARRGLVSPKRLEAKMPMAGRYYEELTVGEIFKHQPGRTITETDNLLFTALTMNPQPLHLDAEFSKKAEFGQRLVNSIFTLGLVVGLSVGDTTLGTTVGNLGFEKVEFPKPVFIGDTLYAETEVADKRESRSRPEWGIVIFEHRGKNQRDEIVMRCRRAAMMRRRAR